MLKIKEVTKIYKTDDYEQKALDKVSINFRKNEFVSILGASGSGKSTLLNIIGGLDHYTTGDLIIDNISTKNYRSSDWDEYRNNKIGFIFQNYNLISHQTILSNVELALTLSGIRKSERKKRAKEALKKVGLEKHLKKRPTQLSGGQMQRVAIARALVNNPDIVLADEPTGALDSETSIQIMNILKEVAKDKLVIMVTHNPELAKNYSTRIITLKDGKIISDSNPCKDEEESNETKENKENNKKSSMGLFTALSLSMHNLATKKGRTALTAIAGSVGIVGIALILALSNGINKYMDNLQRDSSSYMPISIKETSSSIFGTSQNQSIKKIENIKDDNKIITKDDISNNQFLSTISNSKKNNLQKFREYLNKNESRLKTCTSNIEYKYDIDLQIYNTNKKGEIIKVNPQNEEAEEATDSVANIYSTSSTSTTSLLKTSFQEITKDDKIFNEGYEVIAGKQPQSYNELILVVDEDNNIPLSVIYSLGIEDKSELKQILEKVQNKEDINIKTNSYNYNDLIGKEYKLILNSNFYEKSGDSWIDKSNDAEFVNNLYNDGVNLKVVGIAKSKSSQSVKNGIMGYTDKLTKYLIEKNRESSIGKEQLNNKDKNVFTGTNFDGITSTYEKNIKKLGIRSLDTPSSIEIYPKDYQNKKQLKKIIEEYNSSVSEADKISYEDMIETLNSGITNTINILSYILIAFIAISLIVSSIMISIITYISVLERTKEIGILRAIGASKKDVRRVFKAETIIEGFISGSLGVVVSLLLIIVINFVISIFAKIDNFASLPIVGAITLIAVSILLTLFAGSIPAGMASKKDPVESLRGE